MTNKIITLPFGEMVNLRDVFTCPENADTLCDPEILDDFGRDGLISRIYDDIRPYWRRYEQKHGRHVYDFDACVLSQIDI